KEIRRSAGIDNEVVQDQRQQDDNDLQDERQDQPKEEEVEPRRSKRARIEKVFRPNYVPLWKMIDLRRVVEMRVKNLGKPAERISNDSEEIARVLTSIDAATVLARETNVPTNSGFIPTVGPPATVISTGSEVGPTAKEKQEREDMRMNEQIAKDVEVARILAKEEIQGERSYWQIIRLGGSSACYQFFIDLLRQLDREDLNQPWALVKEYLSIRPASTWKLYDLSGVHYVTTKDKEIFMLVEKDYPLRRGLALVMISYRLQVENHSQMAKDLIRKIYNIAKTPRKQSD
nr:hypothetical protein [Tanacetum cinerariifolium]